MDENTKIRTRKQLAEFEQLVELERIRQARSDISKIKGNIEELNANRPKIHVIEGEVYIEFEIVELNGKKYQEFKCTTPGTAKTKYAEMANGELILVNGELALVEDWDTLYPLLIKRAYCVLSLHGVLILDGEPLTLNDDEYVIQDGKLIILNKDKRAIFNKYVNRPLKKSALTPGTSSASVERVKNG